MRIWGALLFLSLSVVPGEAARPVELGDYYRFESAATPAMSPDGRWVVFVRQTTVEAENRHRSELWISPADGSAPAKRLTREDLNATNPRWSPDGKLLAFNASGGRRGGGGGEGGVWFIQMDQTASEPMQIQGVGGAPIFSPDNRWIAFVKRTPPPAKTRELSPLEKQLSERFKGRAYDWMNYRMDQRGYLPDPRDPSATPPSELYIVAREGGTAKQLTHLDVDVAGVAWRPDSAAIAFSADTHQRDQYSYERNDLWTVDLEGNTHRLTDDGYEYDSPAWSPDGKTLAFRRRQSMNQILQTKQDHGAAVDIYEMPAAGGSLKNLTADFDLIPEAPTWHGDNIYFGTPVGGDTQLFRVSANGGKAEQITKGGRSFGGFSFSSDFTRMAFIAQDPIHPPEAFASKVDGSGEARLSSFNAAILGEVELNPAEVVHYKSKDGTQIEGWMILPHSGSRPYPMILCVHGGPHGAYGSHFDFEFQWLAANGYAVFYANPRGSTGYGEKFQWAIWGGGWGKLDYQDLMSGVDYALAKYPIDSKRLGVTGYSYGGFMTDWILGHTDRFSAAMTGAGMFNLVSHYGTNDIPRTRESEFFGYPWEPKTFDLLRAQSPFTYVANVKTPTLFVHGESDMRCPIEEAEQFYRALTKRHVPAKFIRYPGDYHGGWPPWDMAHRYYNEVQWFNQYLHTGGTGADR